jgi:hypothetical protein
LVVEVGQVELGLVDFVDEFLHHVPDGMAVHRNVFRKRVCLLSR